MAQKASTHNLYDQTNASRGRKTDSHRPNRRMQNFLLLWVDGNVNESNEDSQQSLQHLRGVVNEVKLFTQPRDCIDFLQTLDQDKAFVITSGAFGQQLVPEIHPMPQLETVYVFCDNREYHEPWAKDWSKVKGVHTQIKPICVALQLAVTHVNQDSTPISFVELGETGSNINLNQLGPSFMYTQLFKNILIDMPHEQEEIRHLLTYYRNHPGIQKQSGAIEEFSRDYRENKAIWWYTRQSFIFEMLNQALRQLEADMIVNMGFFIHDLHRQLEQLHREQATHGKWATPFTVYRGQRLSIEQFAKLEKTRGGLMSFNSFLSTSLKPEVSLLYADVNLGNPDTVSILFVMTVDPQVSSTPFADIQEHSYFQTEAEILFSMHTVFRIGAIKDLHESGRLFEVQLTLTSDDDEGLRTLTKRINQEVVGDTGWARIGNLLIRVGQLTKAEELYLARLEQTKDESDEALYNHQLGYIKDHQGDYEGALQYYQKALDINEKTLPANHPSLATSYNNVGSVYQNMGEYPKALYFLEKVLDISKKTLPANHPSLAISYNNIGTVCMNMGEYPNALAFLKKARDIYEKTLPANHPSLATSYNNIGAVYKNMGEYPKALSFYEKALEILQKSLPDDHPDVASSYNNIGSVYDNMGEYQKALSFYEKALDIRQKTLANDHPSLATSYNNIGAVYKNIGEYPKALSFYEKALDIQQKTLRDNHPSLATSYNNIGSVYQNRGEYPQALSFKEKALNILQKTLPANHPLLAISYNNIGLVYQNMGEYQKALSFYEKDLEISQKTLPANHPSLATSYNNIGGAYYEMKYYSMALTFFQKAMSIWDRSLPPAHHQLGEVRKWIKIVKQKL